jgi:NAD(P)-dependent dehydrogenase (short-subunit alcohol dehydrogenase family)
MIAAITGGGRGIGRAIAAALARTGASVIVLARSGNELAETVASIPGSRSFELDVTDAAAVARVFRDIGDVDLLVNNAGSVGPLGPLAEGDVDDWWRTLAVNVRGPLLCMRAVLPAMIARRHGRIVNVSSGVANMAVANFSSYVTSKAALNKMTECVAAEVKAHGVSVFAISPGPVRTAMSEAILQSEEGRKWMPWFEKVFAEQSVPPARAAELVVRLASGKYDALSGGFLSIGDNLDALLGAK